MAAVTGLLELSNLDRFRAASAQESRLVRLKPFFPWIAVSVLLAWCLSGEHAEAEVRLSGTADRIVLTTNDATIAEILAALRTAFDIAVTLKGTTARKFTGTYIGSPSRVLSRVLKGEDYVLRSASDGISIRLLDKSASDSAVVSSGPEASQGSRLVALRQGRLRRNGGNE